MATIALSSRYGSKLAYDTGICGESYRLFAAKFISWLAFLDCAKGDVRHWKCGRQTLWLILGMAFMDDRVVGNEKGCYWLSNDIVGLVGNLVV